MCSYAYLYLDFLRRFARLKTLPISGPSGNCEMGSRDPKNSFRSKHLDAETLTPKRFHPISAQAFELATNLDRSLLVGKLDFKEQ